IKISTKSSLKNLAESMNKDLKSKDKVTNDVYLCVGPIPEPRTVRRVTRIARDPDIDMWVFRI
ncbi:hypothetical protein PanWU01x14_347470, partial [Parasponia andersonii]